MDDRNGPQLLVSMFIKYQVKESILEFMARYNDTKKIIFNYIISIDDIDQKYKVLCACVKQAPLNIFFQVKTGFFKKGKATNKLSKLETLHKTLENQVYSNPVKICSDVKLPVGEIPPRENIEEIKLDEALIVAQAEENDVGMFDIDNMVDTAEWILDYAAENTNSILLLLSFMVGGAYLYCSNSSQENNDVGPLAHNEISNYSAISGKRPFWRNLNQPRT